VNENLEKEILKASENAKKMNMSTYQSQRITEETKNQILALKAKHEVEKYKFEKNLKELQDKLKDKDESELERSKIKESGGNKKI